MLTEVAILDEALNAHATVIGRDFTGYRNHAYCVLNLCVASAGFRKRLVPLELARLRTHPLNPLPMVRP